MQASSFLRNVPYTFPIPGIVIGILAMLGETLGLPASLIEWCGVYWWIVFVIGFLLLVVFRAIELLWTRAGSR